MNCPDFRVVKNTYGNGDIRYFIEKRVEFEGIISWNKHTPFPENISFNYTKSVCDGCQRVLNDFKIKKKEIVYGGD